MLETQSHSDAAPVVVYDHFLLPCRCGTLCWASQVPGSHKLFRRPQYEHGEQLAEDLGRITSAPACTNRETQLACPCFTADT